MKNLENYGVLEMSSNKIQETSGGIIPLLVIITIDVFFFSTFAGAVYESDFAK